MTSLSDPVMTYTSLFVVVIPLNIDSIAIQRSGKSPWKYKGTNMSHQQNRTMKRATLQFSGTPTRHFRVLRQLTELNWINDRIKKKSFPFFLQILKACSLNIWLAKFWALSFIRRLFILSVSFGFHGPPLLTFKTDRQNIRGLDLEKMTSFTH